MNPLPVITRELIVRARLPQMHWGRLVFAAVGVVFCLQYFLLWAGVSLAQVGGYAFQTLAWMAFLAASVGFVLTADSVSSERREGTLGLLFLTRIGIRDVLAGKLVSAGLGALLGLVAITPVLMLPVLAGGVRWAQVVLVALSLPGLLFFSLCVGLWASSKSTRMGQATTRAAFCLGVIIGLPLILSRLEAAAGATVLSQWLRSLSPAGAFFWGSSPTATFAHPGYWRSVAAGFVFGGVLLAVAAHTLERTWRDDTDSAAVRLASSPKRLLPVGDGHPLRWLLRRSKAQARAVWLGALLLVLPTVLTRVMGALRLGDVGITLALHLGASFAAWLLFSYAGAVFFLEARRTGALELLWSTPEGAARGVTGQWEVLRGRITGPLVIVLTVSFLFQVVYWSRFPNVQFAQVVQLITGLLGTALDVVALCWLGMWFGYRARTTWSALLWPVGLVTGLNLLVTYALYGVYVVVSHGRGSSVGLGAVFITLYLMLPRVITITKQIWLIRWAKRRLHRTLSGAPLEPLELRQQVSLSVKRAMAAVKRARHWTPGSGA